MGWFAKTRSKRMGMPNMRGGQLTLDQIIERNTRSYSDDPLGLFKSVFTLGQEIDSGREELKSLRSTLYQLLLELNKEELDKIKPNIYSNTGMLIPLFEEIYEAQEDHELAASFAAQSLNDGLQKALPPVKKITQEIQKLASLARATPAEPIVDLKEREAAAIAAGLVAGSDMLKDVKKKGTIPRKVLDDAIFAAARRASNYALRGEPEEAARFAKESARKLLESRNIHQLREDDDIFDKVAKEASRRAVLEIPALVNPVLSTSFIETIQRFIPTKTHTTTNRIIPLSEKGIEQWKLDETKQESAYDAEVQKQKNGELRPPGWSLQLYDPKDGRDISGSHINKVKSLMVQCDKFKKSQSVERVYLLGSDYGLKRNSNAYGFVVDIFLNPAFTMEKMVSFRLTRDRTIGCDAYEILAQLFVLFGGISGVNPRMNDPAHNYTFADKFEIGSKDNRTIFDNLATMFRTSGCRATSENGISDVSLFHVNIVNDEERARLKDTPLDGGIKKIYKMSVKYYANETSPEKDYDISDLYTHQVNNVNREHVGLIVFVKNRGQFTEKCVNAAAERYDAIKLCQQIYGWEQDVKGFLDTIRTSIFKQADEYGITPIQFFHGLFDLPDTLPKTR